jgi:hypothetical protein
MPRFAVAQIIHPFVAEPPSMRGNDLRFDPRWSYPVIQLVAFHAQDEPVTKEMLQAVRCHDISLGGISFFLPKPPPFKHCTIVLGRPPALIFVRAKVIHYEATGSPSHDWRIGCQFLEKVESLLEDD